MTAVVQPRSTARQQTDGGGRAAAAAAATVAATANVASPLHARCARRSSARLPRSFVALHTRRPLVKFAHKRLLCTRRSARARSRFALQSLILCRRRAVSVVVERRQCDQRRRRRRRGCCGRRRHRSRNRSDDNGGAFVQRRLCARFFLAASRSPFADCARLVNGVYRQPPLVVASSDHSARARV